VLALLAAAAGEAQRSDRASSPSQSDDFRPRRSLTLQSAIPIGSVANDDLPPVIPRDADLLVPRRADLGRSANHDEARPVGHDSVGRSPVPRSRT
jgi:hypothetical protein